MENHGNVGKGLMGGAEENRNTWNWQLEFPMDPFPRRRNSNGNEGPGWASAAPPEGKILEYRKGWIHAGNTGNTGRGWIPAGNTGNTGRERIRAMNTLGIHRETIPNPGAFSHFPNPGSCPHCGISTLGIVGFMESWKKLEKLQAQFHGKVGIPAPGC